MASSYPSEVAAKFLEYMQADPRRACRLDHLEIEYPDWLRSASGSYFPLQSWPTYIGKAKLSEFERAKANYRSVLRLDPRNLYARSGLERVEKLTSGQ